MDSFFAELKTAREAKGIPLTEISEVTLISMKMLEALEHGNVDVAPQAYIRAFIREYAGVVGLDVDETLRKYDEWRRHDQAKRALVHIPASQIRRQESPREKFERLVPAVFRMVVAVVVLVLIDIVLWSVLEKEPAEPVKEAAFSDVVRENERRAGMIDSTEQERAATRPSQPDSLTLVATTTDSVWLQIVLDDSILTEHLLYPHTTFTWKAKQEFWISAIGNPTAIKLALNGKPIGVPVRPGFVTRDLRITRDSLHTR